MEILIDVKGICGERPELALLPKYESKVLELAGQGNDVTLTGIAPMWLFMRLTHALHGRCRGLSYMSPAGVPVVIF
jgi:hypothetical protein